ncbi:unnamed protein product [Protopolystoma xenopodis]|uniref:Uncharacterized protein n=1 Tax=Protopolystoma xenopodis TaxID=117903 RepID=A0A3S5AEG9_9PLAT|nr:unnamed protein product [Protopolystoma xenopodis]
MIPCSYDVRHMTDESLAPFHRNRRRLLRKQRQHECYSKANRQLVKWNPSSSSARIDLRISSPNTFTRNGNERFLETQLVFASMDQAEYLNQGDRRRKRIAD